MTEQQPDPGSAVIQPNTAHAHRHTSDPPEPSFDVFLAGQVFMDLIFTGMQGEPTPGTELWAGGLGSAPGGIANLAVAMSRLGLRVSLAAAFGDDAYGDYLWHALESQEEVDLTHSVRVPGWTTPLTVSLAFAADRSMVTYGVPTATMAPVDLPDQVKACFIHVDQPPPQWVGELRRRGTKVFGDLGWDPTQVWSPVVLDSLADLDVFAPNQAEAQAYTGTTTPEQALDALAERVPLVVVKCGARGAVALDSTTGERVAVPALNVDAVDPTGAGDVFAAAFVFAAERDWTLTEKVQFANLCAGLSVRYHSGSLGAPCWHDISGWVAERGFPAEYEFVRPWLPESVVADRVRATPTLQRRT